MTPQKYISRIFPIECRGRNEKKEEVLETSIEAKVKISKSPGSNILSSIVECQYNTGGHGQRCKASHPEVDKVGEGILCPYAFDIPYAFDYIKKKRTYKKA